MHFVIQTIYYSDFKSLFKNLLNPAIAAAIAAVILVTFSFDLVGYDNYLPKENKLESVAISSYSFQGYTSYFDFESDPDEYGQSNMWIDIDRYRLEHMNITDRALVEDFVKAAIEDNARYNELLSSGAEIDYQDTSYVSVNVKFNLKNGKSVYRSYNINLFDHLDLYDRLFRNEEYKKGVFEILSMSEEDIDEADIRFSNVMGEIKNGFTDEQKHKLISAYKEDLANQSVYDLQREYPLGYMYKYVEIKNPTYVNTFNLCQAYIYPSFTRTLALLGEYGVQVDKYLTVDNIEKITVTNYHYDEVNAAREYVESQTDSVDYTDPEQIKKLFSVVVPMEMSDAENALKRNEAVDVQITFKQTPPQTMYPISYYFPKGTMPDFVQKDVNYIPKSK